MSTLNFTDPHLPHPGWVSSSRDRGSVDILWSCCFTIVLCCWVATHPNALAPTDTTWHRFLDKLNLAVIGLLGPDFLFGFALGQYCSARKSVQTFKREKSLCNGAKWSLSHAFFVEMGGIHLKSPDFEMGFPITNTQLYYLVKHGQVDFPDITDFDIDERNTVDTLARLLTLWQVFWFALTEFTRLGNGLPMTTLELTALSFVFVMVATELCWLRKPSPMKPRSISTKDNKRIRDIREYAKKHTHPDLTDEWYRTPMTFVDGKRFQIDTHWSYYIQLAHRLRLTPARPVTARPWDRIPSDTWLPIELWAIIPAGIVLGVLSLSFLAAWMFYFPTLAEQLIWRVVSAYHAFFGLYGGLYYLYEVLRWHIEQRRVAKRSQIVATQERAVADEVSGLEIASLPEQLAPVEATLATDPESLTTRSRYNRSQGRFQSIRATVGRIDGYLDTWRNVSIDEDPDMTMKLKVVIPVTIVCGLYAMCRLVIFVEDFSAMREQPVGVYLTVNRFVPFMGN